VPDLTMGSVTELPSMRGFSDRTVEIII
jgi:hypothetical protein